MSLLFGLKPPQIAKRVTEAATSIVINVALWFLLPDLLLSRLLPVAEVPVGPQELSGFATAITVLATLKVFLRHHAVGAALGAGSSLISAVYLFVITNGGQLAVNTPVGALTLRFEVLLWLLMVPPLLNVAANVWQSVQQATGRAVSLQEVVAV